MCSAYGQRWINPGTMPAAVLSYFATDPSETVASIIEDLYQEPANEIRRAVRGLHARGMIRRILYNPGRFTVTTQGRVALELLLNRRRAAAWERRARRAGL